MIRVVLSMLCLVLCLPGRACLAAQPVPGGVNLELVQRLVGTGTAPSIEQLLALLPATFRSRYALVFDSRSLHGSSFANPRVLLYSEDAAFILSFNGEPSQRGYRALEMMQFDEARGEFSFQEISFPEDGPPVSEARSGERCAACHGLPARPIWDTFPTWPGAYGERYGARLSAPERDGLTQFLAGQRSHPRYRYLLGIGEYAQPDAFHPSAKARYNGAQGEPANARLAVLLARLNFRAILAQVRGASAFDAFQYALLGTLDPDCGALEGLVPRTVLGRFSVAFGEFAAAADKANARQSEFKEYRTLARRPARTSESNTESLDKFRYLAEQGLGLPTGNWTLALEKNTFDFSLLEPARLELEALLFEDLARSDPRVRELRSLKQASGSSRYCGYLERRSHAALLAWVKAPQANPGRVVQAPLTTPAQKGPPPVLERCIACHVSGVGPAIAFDQPSVLARRLREGQYPRGSLLDEIRYRLSVEAGSRRMPLGSLISEADRVALELYLRSLAEVPPSPTSQAGYGAVDGMVLGGGGATAAPARMAAGIKTARRL